MLLKLAKLLTISSSLLLIAILNSFHWYHSYGKAKPQDIQLTTDLVVVDVQVLSKKSNSPINQLKQDDFIVREDGITQKISHFGYENVPFSIMLMVDVSFSVMSVREQISICADQALKSLKPEDTVALMAFNSAAWLVQDFTTDKEMLAKRLHIREDGIWDLPPAPGWSAETPSDGTRIADSIYQASEYMRKSTEPMRRRVIIVITDNKAQSRTSRYLDNEVISELYESGAVVYGVKVNIPLGERMTVNLGYAGLPQLVTIFNRNKRNVTPYAVRTGGLMLAEDRKLAESLSKIMDLLRQRYSLGYTSTNSLKDGKFRKIHVKVRPEIEKREGRIIILAKQGYYSKQRVATDKINQENHK